METITLRIPPEEDGATVRHILKAKLHFSSHAISRLTRAERGILVNGRRARTVDILRAGDVLTAETGDQRPPKTAIVPGPWPLSVLWEDGHLLAADKPAGMTAHASNFLPNTPTVAGALAWERGTDFIFHPVNRLDKGTTGIMIVAKSGYIHDRLRKALHTESFRREYRAVCLGCPEPEAGTVDHYEVLARGPGLSLLRLCPETGRTHQLRLHMASLGYPLAGDWLYGTEDPDLIARPALHSRALELTHPVTGECLRLTAPLPEDMRRLLSGWGEAWAL